MSRENDLCRYVDVFYGNGMVEHFPEDGIASKWFYIKALCGNTTPHAVLPFGKMSVGAYSGGYPTGYGTHYPNSCGGFEKLSDRMKIRGFSHLHQSGSGATRFYYNYAIVTPFYGALENSMSYHEPSEELARPGWYSTRLQDILCEFTVNKDTAIHRYRFPKADGRVAVDFSNDGLQKIFGPKFYELVTDGELINVANNEVLFSGNMQGIKLYFCACVEIPGKESGCGACENGAGVELSAGCGTCEGGAGADIGKMWGNLKCTLFENCKEIPEAGYKVSDAAENYGAVFDFEGNELLLKLSYSTIGYEKARGQAHAAAFFDETADAAYDIWNQHLSTVTIETDREDLKKKFYSNLYFSLIKPVDMTGEQMLGVKDDLVVDFGTLWDQYKTACPLIYLLYPKMGEKIVKALVNTGRTLGKIPCGFGLTDKFPSESQAKVLGVLTLCDAYYTGIKGVDPGIIAECIQRELAREDFASFLQEGLFEKYTHILDVTDGCFAAAKIVENAELKAYLQELGSNWIKAYGEDGLLSEKSQYYEGNKYTYSFRLQQNMEERIAHAGGAKRFVQLLDNFFGYGGESVRQITTEEEIPLIEEISNRLHRFQGFNNEGDIESPYAYIYAGRQDRTCEIAHEAVEKSFGFGKGGIPGNNDSGALSSCFIWNALGIFPASGKGEFLIGTPHMDRAVLQLSNGKQLELIAKNLSPERFYVEKVLFNGEEITNFRIPTHKLMQGGTLVYYMM